MASELAVFRTPPRRVGRALLVGAVGGFLVGAAAGLPVPVGLLFGGLAAALAVGFQHATGPRLLADEHGLRFKGVEDGLSARWTELRLGFGRSARADGGVQRYAILADPRGRSFAFADFAGQGPCRPVPGADGEDVDVVDLREAALLLALVVQRTPAWHVLPPALLDRPVPERTAPEEDRVLALARQEGAPTSDVAPARDARPRVGLWGLVAKLGGGLVKALKTANLGWAAASAATYGLLFSWKFAAALLLQLFVHEYGHVHAMRRSGMKVRGMYFVPFLGAVAVTEDQFTSRRQQAWVALAGPVWGSTFSLLPLALWWWTGNAEFAAIAGWWLLINLFNLIPIAPLDGGRVLQALAMSFSSFLGVALAVIGLGAAVVAGLAFGWELLWLVAVLGAMELVAEARSRAGGRALRLLPERARFGADHFRWLRAVVGPPLGSPSEPYFLRDLERNETAARAAPLTPREVAAWGVAYAGLAAALLAAVAWIATLPGAASVAALLS